MKILKVIHYRCGDADGYTFMVVSRAGLGKFAGGKILAFPSQTVPGGKSGVLAYYNTGTHLMALAAGGENIRRTLQTLTHEYGHKVYFEGLETQGRHSWKEFFEATQGTPPNVDSLISSWEAYASKESGWEAEKYGRFFSHYYGKIKTADPDSAMWLSILMHKLDIKEDFHPLSGSPKKGTKPGLDLLQARNGEAQAFLYPITAYSASSAEELFAEVFAHYLTLGPASIPEIVRDQFHRAVPMLKLGALPLHPATH